MESIQDHFGYNMLNPDPVLLSVFGCIKHSEADNVISVADNKII